MELYQKIAMLYDKDTSAAYKSLQELEALSEAEDVLYPYVDQFLDMIEDEKYVIRVRGFRLLCKQAQWDTQNRIDAKIHVILQALGDDKPTAVRQKLKALEDIARYKKTLHSKIREKVLCFDYLQYKDTMHGLIRKDIESLLQVMDSA